MKGPITNSKTSLMTLACAVAVTTAACGSSPTAPDASVGAAGQSLVEPLAQAGGIVTLAGGGTTRLNFSVDLTVPGHAICSQTPVAAGELHGTGVLTVVLRSITDPNGGSRLGSSIHGHGTATDATGATWVWSDADLNNELFDSGNTSPNSFSQTVHEGFKVIGPQGQHIMVVGTFHLTTVNGSLVVEVEHGNHEEAAVCESGFSLTPLP
jgi:hypothetical protein